MVLSKTIYVLAFIEALLIAFSVIIGYIPISSSLLQIIITISIFTILIMSILKLKGFYRVRQYSFKDIYFLSEDFICDNLTPVAYAKIYSPFYPNFDMGRFMELLKLFDVLPDVKLTRMSFGQQKKAMISFALSANTKILLMDEPSNGLDIPSKNQLRQAISSIVTEDKFIVISTHQAKDLDSLIDPVIIMDNDGVILNESIESISEKLCFSLEPQVNPVAIYSELTLGGVLNVSLNTQGVESVVNIEALFNATLNNRDLIVSLFRK